MMDLEVLQIWLRHRFDGVTRVPTKLQCQVIIEVFAKILGISEKELFAKIEASPSIVSLTFTDPRQMNLF